MSSKLDLEELRRGDRRSLSRWFSAVDQGNTLPASVVEELWTGAVESKATVIGLSGPPGAGKSSTLAALVESFKGNGKILCLCVDPTSPVSGGAFLGDRVRLMQTRLEESQLFIRSLGSHGASGAVSPALDDMILIGKNAGFDVIFVEGVGSGQGEVALKDYVDVLCLVLVPESGDSVQLLKAGVLELADFVVLNKSDRPGAELFWTQLQELFPPQKLFRISALKPESVVGLAETLLQLHRKPKAEAQTVFVQAARRLRAHLFPGLEKALVAALEKKFQKQPKKLNPFRVRATASELREIAEEWVRRLFP